jgi:2-dehydro-3-deoxy-D-arabinonate dehydratase
VSSRTIEGANPLYLPQAKVYAGACAVAPGIRPAWEIENVYGLGITMTVERDGTEAWAGATSTAQLNRTVDDLVGPLFAAEQFPDGVILSTGTGIVPEIDFSLRAGDVVTIDIDQVGRLRNPVVSGKEHFGFLAGRECGQPE